jgi:hypothetical protein
MKYFENVRQNEFWNNDLFDVLMILIYKKIIGNTNVCSNVLEITYLKNIRKGLESQLKV